jgi:energy-converting hydrogenase Eha subunit E
VLLAVIGFLAGAFVIVLGATGIAASSHGRLGRVVRHLRHTLHP